jgi:hypothetical protein
MDHHVPFENRGWRSWQASAKIDERRRRRQLFFFISSQVPEFVSGGVPQLFITRRPENSPKRTPAFY